MDINMMSGISLPAAAPDASSNNMDTTGAKPPDMDMILDFLRKNGLKGTEAALLNEAKTQNNLQTPAQAPPATQIKSLESYKSTEAPSTFEGDYDNYFKFIDDTMEVYKEELKLLIYPIFIHMYLNLVYNNHEFSAMAFFDTFEERQDQNYAEYLEKLTTIRKKEHMETDPLVGVLRSNKFVVKMSRETLNHLKRHIQDYKMSTLQSILNDQLHIETYDGPPRNKDQTAATTGSMVGETKKDVNKVKVYYGLLKEPDINIPIDDEDEGDDGDKPKKKKSRRDASSLKKSKNDPNAPNTTRVPLPELRDIDKQEKILIYKDSKKRVDLSSKTLPSICFYTFLNNFSGVCSVTFTDDTSMLAAGFEDSTLKVWTLSHQKLRAMKSGDTLADLDKDSDDILERMMDDTTASDTKTLVAHSGPVYAVSFSPDRHYLLSSSEDGTVRLWSLMTWTNIVCYKGHNYPVFDVQFSNHGFYFVSGGHDRLARLWSTDHFQPLRLLAGHYSDVDCVKFHPNTNYIATGSSDRIVRLFDVMNGHCVRTMAGHKGVITSLCFSPCGRYLASASADSNINIWDLSNGALVSCLVEHSDSIISLSFSREGDILASGGMDNLVCLWDMSPLNDERMSPDTNTQQHSQLVLISCIQSFPTKASPVMCLHFTRRNLLLAAGAFQSP